MAIKRPNLAEMRSVAESLGFSLPDGEIESYLSLMGNNFADYDLIDSMPDYLPAVKYPRTWWYRPTAEENPCNAWYVKTEIKGAPDGKLAGKRVAIKDNIAVAGVPMMNGTSILEGYTPDIDATVVTRLLDAGAVIAGKSQCEFYCLSGGSHTGFQGPVRNPNKPDHSAAGSSSGSAALLAAGEVDLALGGDQGGSIRTPASYCGVVGLKPTWGLVPYTGAMPIELTLDHLGPMSRTVADNALMLEVLAGPDGLDPRQSAMAQSKRYTDALKGDIGSIRIGVLKEGFGHFNAEDDVEASVRAATNLFKKLGALVEEVSVPMHLIGPSIWMVIAAEGATQQLMKDNGHGFNWKGLYVTGMIDAQSAWRSRASELPATVVKTMLLGECMIQRGRGRYYAKAQNLGRKLREEYDRALAEYDLLLMPTTPLKAPPIPPFDAPRELYLQRAHENMANTFPFDITGHPALSVPCGISDGLPIGMMLVGRHYDEMTVYQAAHAFERAADWKNQKVT